jgi:hypothetical protein
MFLRVVRVVIAPGQKEAYWSWAREILDLWDAGGIQRAGGPYATKGPDGEDIAIWLTVHSDESANASDFRKMYSEGHGKALIERRPPLVSSTTSELHADWNQANPEAAPPAPTW